MQQPGASNQPLLHPDTFKGDKTMTAATYEAHIHRPIAEVFEFLADGTNNPLWQPFLVSSAGPDGPIGLGATFKQRTRSPLGFTVSSDCRITVYEPPHRLSVTVVSGGPIRPTFTYTLTPENQVTVVRCVVEYHPGRLARVSTPFFAMLHPLFAWEASWLKRAGAKLDSAGAAAA
jgi:uncharacterized protein YndB with AHSA1/START domain